MEGGNVVSFKLLFFFTNPPGDKNIYLNRTYGTHKNLYISLFLSTIFGPIYYGPP